MVEKRSNAYFQVWRDANREKVRAANRKWYATHKAQKMEYHKLPKQIAYRKQWAVENRETVLGYFKKYDAAHKAERSIYRKEHRPQLNAMQYAWRARNKERELATYKKYRDEHRANNPEYKFHAVIRSGVWRTLRGHNLEKDKHTFELLGYSPKELRVHIEKQFTPKMSWGNQGKVWDLDHKTPLSWFDKNNAWTAWELDNLQPLKKDLNIKKGNRQVAGNVFGLIGR